LIFLINALSRLGDGHLKINYNFIAERLFQGFEEVAEFVNEVAEKLINQLSLHFVSQFLVQVKFVVDQQAVVVHEGIYDC
jgi:hypothetical protein